MRIRDGDSSDPGSGMEKSRIRDKHPGSATLPVTISRREKTNIFHQIENCLFFLTCTKKSSQLKGHGQDPGSEFFLFLILDPDPWVKNEKSIIPDPLHCWKVSVLQLENGDTPKQKKIKKEKVKEEEEEQTPQINGTESAKKKKKKVKEEKEEEEEAPQMNGTSESAKKKKKKKSKTEDEDWEGNIIHCSLFVQMKNCVLHYLVRYIDRVGFAFYLYE